MERIRQEKEIIRKLLKWLRKGLSQKERISKSKQIRDKILSLPLFKKAHTVMFYVTHDAEVDTLPLLQKALNLQKHVVVPTIKNTKRILPVKVDTYDFVPGHYGIPEPKNKSRGVAPEEIDLVIVPGVAFDESCKRIGYGGGYYDVWLRNFSPQQTIGLAYDFQVLESLPSNEKDIPLGMIVTEKRIIVPERRNLLWK